MYVDAGQDTSFLSIVHPRNGYPEVIVSEPADPYKGVGRRHVAETRRRFHTRFLPRVTSIYTRYMHTVLSGIDQRLAVIYYA